MLLRLPRPNPSRRRKKPSGLAIAGTVAAVAVVGLIAREAFSKSSGKPGGQLPGGDDDPTDLPPPDSSGSVLSAVLKIGFPEGAQVAAFTRTSGDVDNIAPLDNSSAVDVHSSDLPVDVVISLDDTNLKNLGVQSLGNRTKIISGQPGRNRTLTFRVDGVDADEPAITVTTEHGFPGHMLIDTLRVFVT